MRKWTNLHVMTMKVKHCPYKCILGICSYGKIYSETLFSHYFSHKTALVWQSKPKGTLDQPPQEILLRSNGEYCAFWVAASALACDILTAGDVAICVRCQTTPVTWHWIPPTSPKTQSAKFSQTLACRLTFSHKAIIITAHVWQMI